MNPLIALNCPNCGANVNRNSLRCAYCGTSFAVAEGIEGLEAWPEEAYVNILDEEVLSDILENSPEAEDERLTIPSLEVAINLFRSINTPTIDNGIFYIVLPEFVTTKRDVNADLLAKAVHAIEKKYGTSLKLENNNF